MYSSDPMHSSAERGETAFSEADDDIQLGSPTARRTLKSFASNSPRCSWAVHVWWQAVIFYAVAWTLIITRTMGMVEI